MSYDFLVETFATERLKTLGVWAQFADEDLEFRPSPVSRSVREQMVHQCLSEDGFFTRMLDISVSVPVVPEDECCERFCERYRAASGERLRALEARPPEWFAGPTQFFDVERSRAWVLVRRIAHTAHHRGQLTTYHRLLGHALYSIYGPTADTGGLPVNGGVVVYAPAPLPGPGAEPVTERP